MTDIVLFQLHFSHLPANRLDSLHEEFLCLDMCGEHGCWRVCHAFGKYTWLKYRSSRCWVPSSDAEGSRRRKNNRGSHPVSPWPHFHCISNYCSQTQIRHQVELQSQGTWKGGGLKREAGGVLVKEREWWKESSIEELVSICLPPLEGRPDMVLSLAQGAYADSMTFFPGTRFYTQITIRAMVSLKGAPDQPNPPAGVKSHGGAVSGLHAKRCGTHVNYRAATPLALSHKLKVRAPARIGHILLHLWWKCQGDFEIHVMLSGTWFVTPVTLRWWLYHAEFEQSFISRTWTEAVFFFPLRVLLRIAPLTRSASIAQ